jgi:hypothetical protein
MSGDAAVWVIDEAHQREARESQARFRALMPDVEIITLTPGRKYRGWYANYIQSLIGTLAGLQQRFIFFDSDTWLVEPIPDVYDILNRYPLAGVHAPARWTCPVPYLIPDAFPELNTGVLGYRNCDTIKWLFEYWRDIAIEWYEIIGDNDQGSLRVALWECATPIWIMPPEYDCRFGFGGFAGGRIKVLHSRGYPYEKAAEYLNRSGGMRAWRNEDLP